MGGWRQNRDTYFTYEEINLHTHSLARTHTYTLPHRKTHIHPLPHTLTYIHSHTLIQSLAHITVKYEPVRSSQGRFAVTKVDLNKSMNMIRIVIWKDNDSNLKKRILYLTDEFSFENTMHCANLVLLRQHNYEKNLIQHQKKCCSIETHLSRFVRTVFHSSCALKVQVTVCVTHSTDLHVHTYMCGSECVSVCMCVCLYVCM